MRQNQIARPDDDMNSSLPVQTTEAVPNLCDGNTQCSLYRDVHRRLWPRFDF